MSAELTLDAALRDIDHGRPEVRGVAIRNLAPALLDQLGLRPPAWWTHIEHDKREQAAEALDRSCDDPAPQNAALARIGLAQLGAPQALARAHEALGVAGDDPASTFFRSVTHATDSTSIGCSAKIAAQSHAERSPSRCRMRHSSSAEVTCSATLVT